MSLQQSVALEPFVGFKFNLEASFYDLQYEVKNNSYFRIQKRIFSMLKKWLQRRYLVLCLKSAVNSGKVLGIKNNFLKFRFFLGLSIITMLQIIIYGVGAIGRFFYRLFRPLPIEPDESDLPPPGRYHKQFSEDNMVTTWM